MAVAIILRENRVEIAAYRGRSSLSSKKRLTLDVGDGFIKNGKIVSPHFLGKLIINELKKHCIFPGELLMAVRSNEIMIESIQISDCKKASVLQRAKEILEADQPTILDKNYIICRRYDEAGSGFCLNVAIVPKILIEQYRALAAAMKCRIGKLVIYADCMAKLEFKDFMQDEKERIIVDIGGDFVQFYHVDGGELQKIYGFLTQQIPFHYSEYGIRKELLDKICQNLLALTGSLKKDEGGFVYLNNAGFLEDSEIRYLKEQLNLVDHLRCGFMQEFDQDLDGRILNTLFIDKKNENNLIAVSGQQERNHKKSKPVFGIMLAAAAGAFLVTMLLGSYWYVSAGQLQRKVDEDEAFLYTNESIIGVHQEHEDLKAEKQYVERMENFLNSAVVDYQGPQERLNEIMEQGESSLNSFVMTSDFILRVEAATASYTNIGVVIEKMEEAGMEDVELLQIQTIEGQERPIIFTISAVYTIGIDKINDDNG